MSARNKSLKNPQLSLFPAGQKSYGGLLLNTRKGRRGGRPLSTKDSIHMVLRSSQAVGEQSFKTAKNAKKIRAILQKFSSKYGVQVLRLANVGNHLHFHIKIVSRRSYICFIRAITSAIAIAVANTHRWNKTKNDKKFWDYRPFTRVIIGFKNYLQTQDYIAINQLEGLGCHRAQAQILIVRSKELLY